MISDVYTHTHTHTHTHKGEVVEVGREEGIDDVYARTHMKAEAVEVVGKEGGGNRNR
jgi:hypothetical protein